jgi:hypothetical protein
MEMTLLKYKPQKSVAKYIDPKNLRKSHKTERRKPSRSFTESIGLLGADIGPWRLEECGYSFLHGLWLSSY